ncbi:Dolichyl-monophosphooligosaccharide--protein glycotransferase AglB [uncultured archaeon]|nr:Dolichyl-monophosphooligosaccharide--protein glycotransferase AglB [uncultured archaeon]
MTKQPQSSRKLNKNHLEKFGKERAGIKEKESKTIFKLSSLSYTILFSIFLLSFYIRGIIPFKNVLNRGVAGFAMDDSVFHMRLVENTIHFFPHRIFYDAFTLYPYGNQLHWGPLFDQLIAFFTLFAGLFTNGGMPSQSTIDTVGAFFPAVLGALVVFPVYVIGKEMADEKAGLLGAFIVSILPGPFLLRSLLGFTDNHVAEVFYLTMTMMFFVIAIKKAERITFDHWLKRDWAAIKTSLTYSLFAGIFFGAYLLNWTNGVFFAVVFGIFVVVQYIMDHFRGKTAEYLGVVSIPAYLVAMIMVLPYVELGNGFSSGYYSLLHIAVTGGGAALFVILTIISREMNRRGLSGYHYLLFITGIILIGLVATNIFAHDLYNSTVGTWEFIFKGREGGGLTIAEASPFIPKDLWESYSGIGYYLAYMGIPVGESGAGIQYYSTVYFGFGYNYYLAYIGIIILCFYMIRRSRAEYSLVAIWSIFVLAIMLAQNRFAYYYAINVALLVGFLGSGILDMAGWKGIEANHIVAGLKKIRPLHIISLILIIAVIGFLPPGNSPYKMSMQSAEWGAVMPGDGFYEWHDALNWMRYNTPDPGLDYYAIYEKPENGTYPYPESAYGVMSWWDYGHIITYWGHRIPNASPFQSGIGGGSSHAPGASTFLTAQTEEDANRVLDKLGTNGKPGARYVVSNAYMAYSIVSIFAQWDLSDQGYYAPVQTSQGTMYVPSTKYLNTMEARLHIFDGNNLKNYRLVHESGVNPQTRGGNREVGAYTDNGRLIPLCDGVFCTGKFWIDKIYGENLSLEYTGYAKIFEYVKGARITGLAPANSTVTLSNTIKTNIGRKIQYSQTTTSDGTYVFTVPYSTLGPIPGETQFDTKPEGPYTVTAGDSSKQIDVGEKDVLEGNTVSLDLI